MPTPLSKLADAIIYLFFLTFSISCNSKNDINTITALNEGLETSSNIIEGSNDAVLYSLENKSYDLPTKEKAGIWYPKAQRIDSISKAIYNYTADIKNKKRFTKEEIDELYKKLLKFKEDVLSTDSSIQYQFKDNIVITTSSFDQDHNEKKGLYSTYFKNSSEDVSFAMLSRIQNNIRIVENKLLRFCNEHVTNNAFIIDDFFSTLVVQSSSIITKGQRIEITAGIGSFSRLGNPIIKINGKNVFLDEMAIAKYETEVQTKVGKYYIPIEISYTDQDGKRQTIHKSVKYTVIGENKTQ